MRAILIAVFVSMTGAASAHDYWQSDNFLECLVGKGAVEVRHGAKPQEAILKVLPECKAKMDPPPSADQDGADFTEFMSGVAYQMLIRGSELM